MSLTKSTEKENWLKMKVELQKTWGKLTHEELDKSKRDIKAIGGMIQQRHGEPLEKSRTRLTEIFKKYEQSKDPKIMDSVKTN